MVEAEVTRCIAILSGVASIDISVTTPRHEIRQKLPMYEELAFFKLLHFAGKGLRRAVIWVL